MQTTKLSSGYVLVTVPGSNVSIGTLKAGDVIRQSMGTELFVIISKYTIPNNSKPITVVTFQRLTETMDSEFVVLPFQDEECVWHIGEVY